MGELIAEIDTKPAPAADVDVDEALRSIVRDARRLAKTLRPEIPGWLAAELTIGQLRLLARLAEHGPTSMSVIGEWLGVSLPTVTGAVERLERRGLVERHHSTDDRRVVEVHLSERSRELLADMAGFRLEVVRASLAVLAPDELAALAGLLHTITERNEGSTR